MLGDGRELRHAKNNQNDDPTETSGSIK